MKKARKSIAVDIDGVLADFEGEFCERFGSNNRHLSELELRYPDVDKSVISEFVDSETVYANLTPMFGGMVALLQRASTLGLNIVLMTSRPKKLEKTTLDWLHGYHAQFDEILFVTDKSEAIAKYNEINPSREIIAIIDDLVKNLTSLPNNCVGIAWEQPWNTGHYPRARYNQESMRVELQEVENGKWANFWEIK